MKKLLFVLVLVISIFPAGVRAQEPGTAASLPEEVRLEGFRMLWQQYNRCSSAALYMQLSYFGYQGSATDIVTWLNPYTEDKSVRLEELIAYVETQGFKGIARTGGTREQMQALLAAGFPMLVENAYWHRNDNNDWMSHNRIMMGYDASRFYFYDPLLGSGSDGRGYGIPYEEFDSRWRDFNRVYLIIYRPEQEEQLMAVLGDQWDAELNAEWTLQQAQEDFSQNADSFSLYNAGAAQLALGDYAAAAKSFDGALGIGLPWRFHWYRFEAFEAYLEMGRYQDVLNLVYQVIANSKDIQEVYYYAGLAYEGMGDPERARANYYAALARNANYPAAQAALDRIGG